LPFGILPAIEYTFDVSSFSSKVISGKIVGNLFASIDLPEPGGPISRQLCPPAAAISSALLAWSCPLTSLKSILYSYLTSSSKLYLTALIGFSFLICSSTSLICDAG